VSVVYQDCVPDCFTGVYATARAQDRPTAQGCAHWLLCLLVPWVCLCLTASSCHTEL